MADFVSEKKISEFQHAFFHFAQRETGVLNVRLLELHHQPIKAKCKKNDQLQALKQSARTNLYKGKTYGRCYEV